MEDNKFYLWNGGFKTNSAKFGDAFIRVQNKQKPFIDFYNNSDSIVEAEKETNEILKYIAAGKLDTTGSFKGIYYKFLKEGSGAFVDLNDTLVVTYKGQLLNGYVFDETKEEPASFHLKRLIKGWQIGLPFSRQGGKIRLIIPSSFAYSIRNLGIIPPNSILIFDIEVLDIKKKN